MKGQRPVEMYPPCEAVVSASEGTARKPNATPSPTTARRYGAEASPKVRWRMLQAAVWLTTHQVVDA